MDSPLQEYTIVCGNPGVGKSTLLNVLIGEAIFDSGVSFGTGLTKRLKFYPNKSGKIFVDTPGLVDGDDAAAKEICKAFQKHGKYQLIFVVTEEEGRVRPADALTMKLVLDAFQEEKNVPYGIIVNKITQKMLKKLEEDLKSREVFLSCLNIGDDRTTEYIHQFPRVSCLADADNAICSITPDLKQFLDTLPSVEIKPGEVSDVKANDIDFQLERFVNQFQQLSDACSKLERDRENVLIELATSKHTQQQQQFRKGQHKRFLAFWPLLMQLLQWLRNEIRKT